MNIVLPATIKIQARFRVRLSQRLIESIKNNNSNIEDFITIIPKIREQFSWENRMQRYNQILHGL